jgi:hypothetical protein
MRWLIGALPDWEFVFRQAFAALKPGGIFESKEASCMITSDDGTVEVGSSALDQWGRVFLQAGKTFGRTFRVYEDRIQRKAMEAAGFVDIKEYEFKVNHLLNCPYLKPLPAILTGLQTPIGAWPEDQRMKEMGMYARLAIEQDVEGKCRLAPCQNRSYVKCCQGG